MSEAQLSAFIVKLRRREVKGSYLCARETAEIMRKVIGSKWRTVAEAIERVFDTGVRLQAAAPHELSIGNVARHVVHILRKAQLAQLQREQAEDQATGKSPGTPKGGARGELARSLGFRGASGGGVLTMSMQDMLLHQETQPQMPNPRDVRALRQEVIGDIGEFITEITDIHANVADMATEHIHANEVIMTFGESNTVCAFLEAAARNIYFDVIVVESAPTYRGHSVARRLSKAGIMTTVVPDSAIFAMMGRCNKVIMGTHAVLANGGIIAPAGSALLASAAKHHSVPVIVVTGLYKLSPLYPHDLHSVTDHRPPSQLMTFEEAGGLTRTSFFNPGFDYIAPEKVGLFISHMGGATPSYVYRLLAEYYD